MNKQSVVQSGKKKKLQVRRSGGDIIKTIDLILFHHYVQYYFP